MVTLADYFWTWATNTEESCRLTNESRSHVFYNQESSLPGLASTNGHGSPTVTARSKTNGKVLSEAETSRKSPPRTLGCQRPVPYPTSSFGKISERMKDVLSKTTGSQLLANIIKHSHLVLVYMAFLRFVGDEDEAKKIQLKFGSWFNQLQANLARSA